MKKILTLIYICLFIQTIGYSQQAIESSLSDDLLIQLQPGISLGDFMQKMADKTLHAGTLSFKKELSVRFGIYLFSGENNGTDWLAFLKRQPEVRSASLDTPLQFRNTTPNDPLFSTQWDMDRIGLPQVWDISTGGQTALGDEIVVAVLDKGIELSHEELQDNIWTNPGEIPGDGIDNDGNNFTDDLHGWNFRWNVPDFSVENHGTNVAGLIGGKGDNGKGISGVNWNVKIMFLAVEYPSEVILAFQYVLAMREKYEATNGTQGAFVIVTNGSFGLDQIFCQDQPGWGAMYDPMGEKGILSVAATANGDWNVDLLGDIPTSCPSEFLLSVTSTDVNDDRASNAAFGQKSIDLGAPGKTTTTSKAGNEYREDFSGTSSACPHVAGAIALLYSMPCTELAQLAHDSPADAARLVRDAILFGSDEIPSLKNITVTNGRLNVFGSLQYLHTWCIARTEERENNSFYTLYDAEVDFIRIFPNPVTSELIIEYSSEAFDEFRVRVFNVLGQEMVYPPSGLTLAFEKQQLFLDVSDWSAGTYFISLLGKEGKHTLKFIKV